MKSVIAALRYLFSVGRGRPLAIVLLAGLALCNLLSEGPLPGAPGSTVRSIGEVLASPFQGGRQALFDGYQRMIPRVRDAQPVTIVEIDEKSLKEIGQWPWPRNRLADLVDAIAAQGPAAIGLDLYMPEADQTSPGSVARNLPQGHEALARALAELPSHESRLAASLRAAPTVLGAAGFDFATFSTTAGLRSVPLRIEGGDVLPYLRHFPWVLASLPELQAAVRGQGMLSVGVEDAIVRRIPLVLAVGEQVVPSLAMEMLRVATDSAAVEVKADAGGIRRLQVADLVVPTQADGEIWLHFARRAGSAMRQVSAADLLAGRAPADALSQKIVLVGLTGFGLSDMRMTPLREQVPGIEIQAQIIESFFDSRFLHRPRWIKAVEIAILLAFGLLIVWLLPEAQARFGITLHKVPKVATWAVTGFNVLLLAVGHLVFWQTGLLFDAAALFIGLSFVVGGLVSSTMVEIDRRDRKARETAQHRRESEALLALQQASARRVRMSVLTPPKLPHAAALSFEIATLHSPEKDFGSDFCDVFMLDARRLWLVVGSAGGDVSSSARFAALTKAVLKHVARRSAHSVEEIIAAARSEIALKNPEELDVTVVIAIFDIEDGTLEICNAGHEPPWLVRAGGDATPLSVPVAPPLGSAEAGECHAGRYRLEAGETLLLLTRGLLRARDAAGNEEFGVGRLQAVIARTAPAGNATTFIAALRDELTQFDGSTDATEKLALLALRRV